MRTCFQGSDDESASDDDALGDAAEAVDADVESVESGEQALVCDDQTNSPATDKTNLDL